MKLSIYTFLLLAGVFLFSCQEDESPTTDKAQEITLGFSVETLAMQQAGEGVPTRVGKDANETAVKSLYLVQFNGNATGSTVVKSGAVSRDVNDHTTVFDFSAVNTVCRVYIVANFNPNVATGTTLANFEKTMATYAARTSVDASVGIPMCDYKDFNPTTVSSAPKFSMTAMVAKLTVTYTVDAGALADFKAGTTVTSLDVVLKNVPDGTAYLPTTTPATAYRPTNVKFSDIAMGKTGATYTYYVPENIAGNSSVSITDWKKRSLKNAPANALYFEISGRHKDDKGTILIASFIGDPAKPSEFNIYRNYAYTLTATITNGKTGSTDERITVKPDYFNLNEDLGNKSANCYIITDNTAKDYGFDATVRGNNATSVAGINYSTLPNLGTATEARLIWQTGTNASTLVIDPNSVRLEDGKVIFSTTGKVTEGNAVLGVFASSAANAECLWSWHIWKLNGTAPSTVTGSKTSATTGGSVNVTMMDRNLGAYNNTENNAGSIGLLYQWGRKDPFPGPMGFNTTEPSNIYGSFNNGGTAGAWSGAYSVKTTATSGAVGTEAWAVKFPTAYITGGDWMSTKNDNLWGTPWEAGGTGSYNKNQGKKSIYDPCPVGYRVPPQDTWSKQTSNGSWTNNGMILNLFHSSLWFPAAGRRNYDSGGLNNSPSNGY